MIDYFDRVYSKIKNTNKYLSRLKYYAFLRLIIRVTVNIWAPIYFQLTRKNKKFSISKNLESEKCIPQLIVSLTSFPERINRLWLVIETIFRQTQKPDKIILWLSRDQFSSLKDLPLKLLSQVERGLEIKFVDGDIKSHKKYYYTLESYPESTMITIDDDMFYRSEMIADLVKYSNRYPFAIIAQYVLKMKCIDGCLAPYNNWETVTKEGSSSKFYFFGSGGGTLFPVNALHKSVLNNKLFMDLTPFADDIWLNTMARLKNTKIINTEYYSHILPILNYNNMTLSSKNNGNLNFNDKQINNIIQYFDLD
jgi:hypothetical protein